MEKKVIHCVVEAADHRLLAIEAAKAGLSIPKYCSKVLTDKAKENETNN